MTKLSINSSSQINTTATSSSQVNKKKIKNIDFLKYAASSSTGAYIGYSIKLPQIDGPDKIAGLNSSNKIILMKTKVPNVVGKYKNALKGVFAGIVLVGLYNILKPEKKHQ